jgi:hypothetical protein
MIRILIIYILILLNLNGLELLDSSDHFLLFHSNNKVFVMNTITKKVTLMDSNINRKLSKVANSQYYWYGNKILKYKNQELIEVCNFNFEITSVDKYSNMFIVKAKDRLSIVMLDGEILNNFSDVKSFELYGDYLIYYQRKNVKVLNLQTQDSDVLLTNISANFISGGIRSNTEGYLLFEEEFELSHALPQRKYIFYIFNNCGLLNGSDRVYKTLTVETEAIYQTYFDERGLSYACIEGLFILDKVNLQCIHDQLINAFIYLDGDVYMFRDPNKINQKRKFEAVLVNYPNKTIIKKIEKYLTKPANKTKYLTFLEHRYFFDKKKLKVYYYYVENEKIFISLYDLNNEIHEPVAEGILLPISIEKN